MEWAGIYFKGQLHTKKKKPLQDVFLAGRGSRLFHFFSASRETPNYSKTADISIRFSAAMTWNENGDRSGSVPSS